LDYAIPFKLIHAMLRLDVCWFFAAALFSYVSSDDDHVL